MPIQILPARLANQIAAGEVVERPASVIKELVENSLDAGASQIDIEVEKGGQKRILIRDNGSGIGKDELTLALSRHATSKITDLDDLEQITSMGFRGEALASISSVSRLTLTSRTAEQSEAWEAHAEGRDMQVELNPAAHPVGTSVDVVDLFFNTPARRKFLRTEKTEFSHIEEVVRRIALSRTAVAMSLKHNGKVVRKYPKASEGKSQRRIAAVCGQSFAEQAFALNSQYQDMRLSGWLGGPDLQRAQNDLQYCYVNGRMMRDKLILHAIRQAFEGMLAEDQHASFVLYLTLPPQEVDVNVHPAKHEVRFQQARLVHDFIYRALTDALQQTFQSVEPLSEQPHALPEAQPVHDYIKPLQFEQADTASSQPRHSSGNYAGSSGLRGAGSAPRSPSVSAEASANYQALMSAPEGVDVPASEPDQADFLLADGYLLFTHKQQCKALTISHLLSDELARRFAGETPVSQPLLMPVSISADTQMLSEAQVRYESLLAMSIEIGWAPKRILVRKVPAGMRQYPWADILPRLLECDMALHGVLGVIAHYMPSPEPARIAHLWQQYRQQHAAHWETQISKHTQTLSLPAWLKADE